VDRGVSAPGGPLEFTGRSFAHNYWAPGTPSPVGRDGVAQLSGDLNFLIPDTDHHKEYKLMQVQITWKPEVAGQRPDLHVDSPGLEAVVTYPVNMWSVTDTVLPDGWMHSTYDAMGFRDLQTGEWVNPIGEQFTISGNIYVDQVVIDTVCIPEPSQIAMGAMLALVGGGYAWRRFRLNK